MSFANCFRLSKNYGLPIFLISACLIAGGYDTALALRDSPADEPLLLLKTGNSSDLIIDRERQLIFSSDNCKNRDSFQWVGDGANPDTPVRRLKVESRVSENLAGKPLSFSLNYDMEIRRDGVRLFVQSQQGTIEIPVTSTAYSGRHPCR